MDGTAWNTLFGMQGEIIEILARSLLVSGSAVVISSLIAIPLGAFLGLTRFPGRRFIMRLTYMLMSLPPVLAGLIVYLLLSRSGPLGFLQLLFTPGAMVIAQVMLVTPIIVGLTSSAVAGRERLVMETARTLGASERQAARTVVREARGAIVAAIMVGFGRAFGEVGAVMLVGGNIRHFTRVLTTSIVLVTREGNFALAIILGVILLLLSFMVSSVILHYEEARDDRRM